MSISLTEDFKTIEELRESPDAIVRQAQKNEHPVVVTVKGKPAVVVLGVKQYEWMVHLINFAEMIAEGEEDIRAGRTRPAEEFFKELLSKNRRAKKIPGLFSERKSDHGHYCNREGCCGSTTNRQRPAASGSRAG